VKGGGGARSGEMASKGVVNVRGERDAGVGVILFQWLRFGYEESRLEDGSEPMFD
jgi:hypothetical protein